MTDILILLGTAAVALSIVLLVVALARTEPPRGAAVAAVAGIAAIVAAAWMDPTPFQVHDLGLAWQRLLRGDIRA